MRASMYVIYAITYIEHIWRNICIKFAIAAI